MEEDLTVKNTYKADGTLTITANKAFEGVEGGKPQSDDQFEFELSSENHPNFATQKKFADTNGEVVFNSIQYDYEDLLYLKKNGLTSYTYRLREVQGTAKDVVYDDTVYIIEVKLADAEADGELDITTSVSIEESTAEPVQGGANVEVDFTNRAEGFLTISKEVVDNDPAVADAEFDFVLTLTDADGAALANQTFEAESGDFKTDGEGKYAFRLSDGEELAISGLPNGALYTVTETNAATGESYESEGFVPLPRGPTRTPAR